MKLVSRFVLTAIMIFIFALPTLAAPSEIEEISSLQKGLKSVKAPFKQKKHTELLPRPVKSKGTFYFKEGSGVRWVYDDQMVAIYDGKTLFMYYTEMDEAEQVDGIAGFSGPLSFNVAELSKDYAITPSRAANGNITLKLAPKQRMPFESMKMIFKKGEPFPFEVRVFDETGDETVISFISPEFNVPLRDKLFAFKPPKGVVVRHRKFE